MHVEHVKQAAHGIIHIHFRPYMLSAISTTIYTYELVFTKIQQEVLDCTTLQMDFAFKKHQQFAYILRKKPQGKIEPREFLEMKTKFTALNSAVTNVKTGMIL